MKYYSNHEEDSHFLSATWMDPVNIMLQGKSSTVCYHLYVEMYVEFKTELKKVILTLVVTKGLGHRGDKSDRV